MRRASALLGAIAGVLAIGAGDDAKAQTSDSSASPGNAIVAGERVQLHGRPADSRSAGAECDGYVGETSSTDTLVIERATNTRLCPRWTYAANDVAELRVMRGHRGSRGVHALIGLGAGVVFGATAVYAGTAHSCDNGSSCEDIRAAAAVLSGITFGVLGAGIGALLPAGPKWVTVPVTKPVRVAGLTLTPRVGLALRR